MSEEKSKPNGTDPSQRLPSFKPPRDLSLGGVKPKKVFIPNLNVSRNKNKGPSSSSSQDSKKDDRYRGRDRNNRQRHKNGPKVIKSGGVFSEGLGSSERQSNRASYSRGSGDSTPQVLQRPTIRVKDVIKIDKELEEQKIKYVMGEAGSLDQEEKYDFKQARERDAPINLPMDDTDPRKVLCIDIMTACHLHVLGGFLRQKTIAVKQEVFVKEEPMDEDNNVAKAMLDVKQEIYDTPDIVNLLKSEGPKLMMLQFPQSLPGQAGSSDDELPRKDGTAPSTSTGAGADEEQKPVDKTCSLSDLEEGKIGKLRVYHSGRVTLKLGDTEFEVSMGTQAAFHQEVVSVACDEQSRSANIISLGALAHKLNVVPDWETMFKKMNV